MAGLEEWSSLGEPPLGGNPGTEFGLSSFCGGSFIGWGSAPDPGSALAGAPGPRSDCLAGAQVRAVFELGAPAQWGGVGRDRLALAGAPRFAWTGGTSVVIGAQVMGGLTV